MKMVDAALAYARQGIAVFPLHHPTTGGCSCGLLECRNAGKHPRTPNGLKDATTDAEQVAAWWGRWPDANIGGIPGTAGRVVIDIDGPTGVQSASALGLLSEPTLEVTTGREDGGRHRWYLRPTLAPISNVALAPGLDVRGDAGYVVLPPSKHRTGRTYRWAGRWAEAIALPPTIAAQLTPGAPRGGVVVKRPAAAIPLAPIPDGQRNAELTRYVGRLFRSGIARDEVLALAHGLNATRCVPPLAADELAAIVDSIARAEARQVRPAMGTIAPVSGTSLVAAAEQQTATALAWLDADRTKAAQWGWWSMGQMIGPLLPGEMHVIAAGNGGGKTAFMLSQMDDLCRQQRKGVLYIPLETDPALCRIRWAAWQVGLDPVRVLRGEWGALPEGARESMAGALDDLGRQPLVHFVGEKRIDYATIEAKVREAQGEAGIEVVMVDHLHRLHMGTHADEVRLHLGETIRNLTDLMRDLGLVGICAAQLNRSADLFDGVVPPSLARLRESAAIGDEATTVHMLTRALRRDITAEDMALARRGQADLATLLEPGVMVVTNRKDRIAGAAVDRSIRLTVTNGRVEEFRARENPTWVHR